MYRNLFTVCDIIKSVKCFELCQSGVTPETSVYNNNKGEVTTPLSLRVSSIY